MELEKTYLCAECGDIKIKSKMEFINDEEKMKYVTNKKWYKENRLGIHTCNRCYQKEWRDKRKERLKG